MNHGGGRFLTAMIKKGDSVRYYGEVYEVIQVCRFSDLVVLRSSGDHPHEVYAWSRKCRKVESDWTNI